MTLIIFVGYTIAVISLFLGLVWWRMKNRPTRHPLGSDAKLQRQAGEHLRKKSEDLMEKLFNRLAALILLPPLAFVFPFWVVKPFHKVGDVGLLVASGALLLAALIWALRWGFQVCDEFQNYRLGWFGERMVADQLDVLKSLGFSIFHDLPCLGTTGPFNLDHVVVGNGIVVVVETKTYRKPKSDPAGHKVSYDGEKLIWPKGQSTKEIEQVQRNADWLKKELKKQLGFDVNVRPALTMPGWFVSGGPPKAPVLVGAPRYLTQCIAQRYPAELPDERIHQVILHLTSRCTDVTYEML